MLYYKTRKAEMGFAEVAETAFSTGPQWARKFAKPSRLLTLFFEHMINSLATFLINEFLVCLQISHTD